MLFLRYKRAVRPIPAPFPACVTARAALRQEEKVDNMKNSLETHRGGAGLVAAALPAGPERSAVGPLEVGVAFWKDSKGEQTSLANDGIDTDRAATLTRQANGTYTLELPLKKLSRINITGRLSGLTIGDVTYDGTLSGSFDDDTALLTIKKPARFRPDRK